MSYVQEDGCVKGVDAVRRFMACAWQQGGKKVRPVKPDNIAEARAWLHCR